jgi:hypothetical protein
LIDNTVKKEKKEKKAKKVKKVKKDKKEKKVDFQEKPEILKERQVNYAVKHVAKTISEILGGNPETYFDLIEKNLEKTTEELIALVLENPI